MATRHAVAVTTTDFRPPHYHPLPLSKISSALVYYITPAPLAIQHCCYQPPHRYYHVDNSNAAPSNHVRIIATHYYHCRWLITNISMIISTATTHRCCVIQYQYAIITGQTSNRGHDVDCYPGGCCRVKMTSFTIAWKTAITISHFSYPLHILTVTTTTIHQRIVSHFIRYLYFTQQRRNIHYILWTLRDSLMSDVLPLSSFGDQSTLGLGK